MVARSFILAVVVFAGTAQIVYAANNTLATAQQAMLGEKRTQTLANADVAYFNYILGRDRSYVAFCWPSSFEGQPLVNNLCTVDIRDTSDAVVSHLVVTEPNPKGGGAAGLTSPGGSFAARIQNNAGSTQTMQLVVMETTLASPWYFVNPALGYEAFVEIRNHTWATIVGVTVRAYDASGTLVGETTPPVIVPANGNTFVRVGADLGITSGSGSLTITHTAMPGGVVANVTVLGTTTGLSFDAPFSPRMTWSIF